MACIIVIVKTRKIRTGSRMPDSIPENNNHLFPLLSVDAIPPECV